MTNSYLDDFFQDVYRGELEQRDRLVSNDGLLVGTLVVLSGVGIYYLKILPSCNLGVGACLFAVLGILFLLCFLCRTLLCSGIDPTERHSLSFVTGAT